MKKINTKIGDIFAVKINDHYKKYFQYIVSDLTQLNSDVIRAFKKSYPIEDSPELSEIVKEEVEFYAHCVTKLGIKMGYWECIGNTKEVGNFENVLFKSSSDDGNLKIKISKNWWVWKINKEQRRVGMILGDDRKAEVGSIIPPDSIVHRMQTGEYDFIYPAF